jgi:uncharacterized protein YcbK (DUF882 family)
MPRYFFHLSTPDACCRDPLGCEVSDLSVTKLRVRARAAQHAGSRMSLSRVICRASLTASLLFVGSAAFGDTRALMLHHVHTDEKLIITYKENGQYDKAALKKINWIMRDWRKNEATTMDPRAIDLLWEIYHGVGAKKPIEIIGGYRSPSTNEMLRTRSPRSGVAVYSQHMFGKAIDFYIPGVSLEKLRETAMRLQGGGVGYYPASGSPFVHLDVGNVSAWPRMTREQLVKLFPDGRTVHLPAAARRCMAMNWRGPILSTAPIIGPARNRRSGVFRLRCPAATKTATEPPSARRTPFRAAQAPGPRPRRPLPWWSPPAITGDTATVAAAPPISHTDGRGIAHRAADERWRGH